MIFAELLSLFWFIYEKGHVVAFYLCKNNYILLKTYHIKSSSHFSEL